MDFQFRINRALLAALCVFLGTIGLWAQKLEVNPSKILVDETAVIRATGLRPDEHVVIQAQLVDGADNAWQSEAEFAANAEGVVDASKDAPVKGSYHEVSAMGLVWSMMPARKDVASYQPPHDLGSQEIEFLVLRGDQRVASAHLEQRFLSDNIRRLNVEGQLHGELLVPNDGNRHPGILVLGGSEGGVPVSRAAWLASHGYAAFALAYFRYKDLPSELENIPLEYFGRAVGWMMQRPDVFPDRIALVGASRGGELALQLGSMYPQIKAVVAYVPADVRYPACCGGVPRAAWTWKGQALAFATPREGNSFERMRSAIPVEQTSGPILLIAGEDDGIWPSSAMVDSIANRLKRAHFRYPVETHRYPHAGHRAGRPEIVPSWHGAVKHPVSGREVNVGGSAEGDALSSIDSIPKVLSFLEHALANSSGH